MDNNIYGVDIVRDRGFLQMNKSMYLLVFQSDKNEQKINIVLIIIVYACNEIIRIYIYSENAMIFLCGYSGYGLQK